MIPSHFFESGEDSVVKSFPSARACFFSCFLFSVSCLLFQTFPAFSDVLTVDDTQVSLSMDGHLQDWPECRMIDLDQSQQVVEGKFFWKGSDNFSGRVFLTYDKEYLYLSAVVTRDGKPTNNNDAAALWNGDCLELFLSTDPSEHRRLTRGDYHIGISPGTNCSNSQVWCFNQGKAVAGARVKAKNSKKGYVLEVALPWVFFSGLNIGPHQTCGFNVALDEGGTVSGNRLDDLLKLIEDGPAGAALLKVNSKITLRVRI